jgi:pimeloyl-ACP methyl ester carboxylesterase
LGYNDRVMSRRRAGVRSLVASLCVAGAALGLAPGAVATTTSDLTSPLEAVRVDRVPAPALAWKLCDPDVRGIECATATVPLDYDEPAGAQIQLALARRKATDSGKRIGTLFVNPGGPGGSAVEMVERAPEYFKRDLRARFDLVGIDPRGTNASTPLRCFSSLGEAQRALAGLLVAPFPTTAGEAAATARSVEATATACSEKPIAGAMSTAEAARDMDVLRRALGEPKLSYYGESYGSFLGQVYANMYPDRVRALAIDGIVEPRGWVGTPGTAAMPMFDRIGSPRASMRAFTAILRRCGRAGEVACPLAAQGDPVAVFRRLAARLRRRPLVVELPKAGKTAIGYVELIGPLSSFLYSPLAFAPVTGYVDALATLAGARSSAAARAAARGTLAKILVAPKPPTPAAERAQVAAFVEGRGVMCGDGLHAATPPAWSAAATETERRFGYFGGAWSWIDAVCASRFWTAHDEDAYRGPFDRRTDVPVLVVGARWDNATSYDSAVAVSHLLPNSQLLSSDNWGHTSYTSSTCAADAIDRYLITTVPPRQARCPGDLQPFEAGARPR